MLSSAQSDEFGQRGILRLPATIPLAKVTAMRQRVWEHLLDKHAIHQDRPETWTVHMPAQFQRLTGTGAFDAMATGQLCAVIDDLLGAGSIPERGVLMIIPYLDLGWRHVKPVSVLKSAGDAGRAARKARVSDRAAEGFASPSGCCGKALAHVRVS
jgi:hypothetical protein